MAETLPGKLASEIGRVSELRALYLSLPNGAGAIGAAMMKASLDAAKAAASSPDIVPMIRALKDLEGFRG